MRNRMYGGVRGRKMKVGGKLLHFPPTRFAIGKTTGTRNVLLCSPHKVCDSIIYQEAFD